MIFTALFDLNIQQRRKYNENVLSIQSHVVYGFAGNKSATFPMQLLGVDVWALNTVQFSNHTQYGKWTGMVIPQEQIREIVTGLDNIEKLQECDALLSGYLDLRNKSIKFFCLRTNQTA